MTKHSSNSGEEAKRSVQKVGTDQLKTRALGSGGGITAQHHARPAVAVSPPPAAGRRAVVWWLHSDRHRAIMMRKGVVSWWQLAKSRMATRFIAAKAGSEGSPSDVPCRGVVQMAPCDGCPMRIVLGGVKLRALWPCGSWAEQTERLAPLWASLARAS